MFRQGGHLGLLLWIWKSKYYLINNWNNNSKSLNVSYLINIINQRLRKLNLYRSAGKKNQPIRNKNYPWQPFFGWNRKKWRLFVPTSTFIGNIFSPKSVESKCVPPWYKGNIVESGVKHYKPINMSENDSWIIHDHKDFSVSWHTGDQLCVINDEFGVNKKLVFEENYLFIFM